MESFPAFIPLTGLRVVVIGENEAAEAKARLFDGAPCRLDRLDPAAALAPGALKGARLVFIADADDQRADRIARQARAEGALVNRVDRPEGSDFLTPSIVDRGPVVGAITTSGAAPVLATRLRQDLEHAWPGRLGDLAELLRHSQKAIRAALPDTTARRAFLRRQLDGETARLCLEGDAEGASARLQSALAGTGDSSRGALRYLEDHGTDEGLTLGEVRFLGAADRIIADATTTPAILSHARRDAPRHETASDAEIEAWLEAGENLAWIRQAD